VFVTDDQRADGTLDAMPKTRSWFEEGGTRFHNAFATTTLCCPGRASIFTGRYAHNHGIRTNGGWDLIQQLDQRSTLQRYLKDAGYRTALVGKYFYSWNRSVPPPFVDDWALTGGGYHNAHFVVNGRGQTVPYSTDFVADQAVGFLEAFDTNDGQPWFLYVGTNAPHMEANPEAVYAASSVPSWEGNPAVFEADQGDKPPWVRTYTSKYGDTFEQVLEVRREQLRTLMSVDDLVGGVFETLQRLGEDRDTLAFFLSDNGYMWGEHGLGTDKRFPYTEAVEIPFLMRWPGHIPAGVVDHRMVANIDVLPTVLQATGLSADPAFPVDGHSLLLPRRRERLLLEYWRSPDGGPPGWASIGDDTFQYIEWYSDDATTVTFREYYKLVADPWQLQNLLGDADPANDPNVAALSALLAQHRDCVGPPCSPLVDLQAKTVVLKAHPNAVVPGKKTTLRGTVAPCPGHEGNPIEFQRRPRKGGRKVWRTTAIKPSDKDCTAQVRRKVTRTTDFRAISPADLDHLLGTSNVVKVRAKEVVTRR
jgi:arylsulfatase A-like enzyme